MSGSWWTADHNEMHKLSIKTLLKLKSTACKPFKKKKKKIPITWKLEPSPFLSSQHLSFLSVYALQSFLEWRRQTWVLFSNAWTFFMLRCLTQARGIVQGWLVLPVGRNWISMFSPALHKDLWFSSQGASR